MTGQAVSEKKIFENGGRRTDGRRTDGRTMEHGYTISSPCEPDGSGELKIGQGHPRVMIYINFVELQSLMLHTKFQNHWPSGSGEEDF